MKKLLIILFVPLCAKAQTNPGFMGIRDVATLSMQVHPWLFGMTFRFAPSLDFSYEHAFNRGFGMEISYAGYKTRMDAEYMNRVTGEDAIFIVDNFNQGTYVYFVGEAGIKHNNFTLRFKKYMGNLGAIAPVGTYMSLDIGTNNWKIKDADYYGMDENKNVYKNKEAPVDVKTVTLGFSIGTRRMLTEHIGLVLRSGLSYPISSSQLITDGYSDNLENLHELVLFNERRANIMRGTLQFQLGVSYNL